MTLFVPVRMLQVHSCFFQVEIINAISYVFNQCIIYFEAPLTNILKQPSQRMVMSFTATVRFTAGVLILSSHHVLSYFGANPDFIYWARGMGGGCPLE
jgi:hypothetical protein